MVSSAWGRLTDEVISYQECLVNLQLFLIALLYLFEADLMCTVTSSLWIFVFWMCAAVSLAAVRCIGLLHRG